MPPDTGGYMVAGYVVTTVILLTYAGSLWRRVKRVTRYELPVTSEPGDVSAPPRNA